MTTRENATPSDPFGQFDEKGYHFEAHIPAGPHERTAFLIVVSYENVPQVELEVPMLYAPVFGVDQGDLAALEANTDKLVELLPGGVVTDEHMTQLAKELGVRRPATAQ